MSALVVACRVPFQAIGGCGGFEKNIVQLILHILFVSYLNHLDICMKTDCATLTKRRLVNNNINDK